MHATTTKVASKELLRQLSFTMDQKDVQLLEAGLGNMTWWGYSPSFNILQKMEAAAVTDEANILLLGASDGRHFIEAMASLDPHTDAYSGLVFWVLEQNLMIYARQMLFISMLFEDPNKMSITDKAKMFLEILGNTKLRASTFEYFTSKSEHLRDVIIHEANKEEGEENKLSSEWVLVDMSLLKYRELDMLVGIFELWMAKGREAMNLVKSFEVRVRKLMQSRLESKEGVFDLDYQLRLVDRGGGSVSLNEYSNFRNNGNPFNFYNEDEKEDTHTPNNSLMSSLVTHTNGERLSRRGYWGDIVTGPFIPFGHAFSTKVDVDTTKLSRTSQEIALVKLEAIITGIQEKMAKPAVKRVSLRFLPISTDRDLAHDYDPDEETAFVAKHKGQFDQVFVGCSVTHLLTSSLAHCLKVQKESGLSVETPLYLLHMSRDVQERFKEYLSEKAKEYQLEVLDADYDPMRTSVVDMKFNRCDLSKS